MIDENKLCIEKNLIDFYASFKNNEATHVYENEHVFSIHNSKNNWPNFVLLKKHTTLLYLVLI